MVKVSVIYGIPTDPAAFEDHYASTHVPLAGKMPHLQRAEYARVVGTPTGEPSTRYRTAELYFASMADLQASFASPEGRAVGADLRNFATGGVEVLVCEVDS